MRRLAALLLLLAAAAPGVAQDGPRLRVLGIAQDGGLPHAGCACDRCDAARADPDRASGVASLAIIVPDADLDRDRVYLIDATPDVRAQLDMLDDVRDAPDDRADREPVDGVFLTHAHIGHYTGLMFFGFEALHTQGLPVWCTRAMAGFLRSNAPWSQLVSIGNITLEEIEPDSGDDRSTTVTLGAVLVAPLKVPHRDELSDTVGYVIAGPNRRVLYVPDTEPWRTWAEPLPDVLERLEIDLALLDGSFYSADELPGRPPSSIGHPLIVDTMELLGEMVRAGSVEVRFTHLNHSNNALTPGSAEREAVLEAGFGVLAAGEEIGL